MRFVWDLYGTVIIQTKLYLKAGLFDSVWNFKPLFGLLVISIKILNLVQGDIWLFSNVSYLLLTIYNGIFAQLLNVYAPKYDAGGRFWPIVHDSTIFSLVLMHIVAIGIFGLKKLPLASGLIIPLPILTLLFHEYCQKRFLPIFKAYPNEVLGVPIILIFLIPQFYSTQ